MFVFYLVGNSFADLFNPQRCKMAKHHCTFQNYKKNNPKNPEMHLNMLFIIKRNPQLQQPNKFNGNLFTDLQELY